MTDEMNEAEKRLKSVGTVTHRMTMPLLFWEEFEKDCKDNYGNTYWMKIQSDHEYKKSFLPITQLIIQDLTELKQRVTELEVINEELIQTIEDQEKSSQNPSETPQSRRKTMGSTE